MNRGFWLGFFFFVSLVLLLAGSLVLGSIKFTKAPRLRVHFDRVEGLRTGDDIRVDGLLMGKVNKVSLDQERGGVMVIAYMDEPVMLYEGFKISVESFTLLGGNYISIERGKIGGPQVRTHDERGHTIPLPGTSKPSALGEVADMLQTNKEALKEMLVSINGAAKELGTVARNMNEGKGTVGKLLTEPKLYDEARGLFAEARTVVQDMRGDLKTIIADMKEAVRFARGIAEKFESGQGLVPKLINDPKMVEDLNAILDNLRKASGNVEQITGKVSRGEGTLGKLVQEDGLYDQAKTSLEDFNKAFGRAARSKVFVGGDYRSYPDTNMSVARGFLRIWPDDNKYFLAGASVLSLDAGADYRFPQQIDDGDDATLVGLELQVMYKIPWFGDNHLGLRAGMIEGRLGGALDVDFDLFNIPIVASLEVRDAYSSVDKDNLDEEIQGALVRLYMRAPLWSRAPEEWWKKVLYSIKLTAGMNRLADNPEFFIGLGLEYEDEDIKTLVGLLGASR